MQTARVMRVLPRPFPAGDAAEKSFGGDFLLDCLAEKAEGVD
jgi:hypothetical protein